jgi:hypothetical protein
MLQWRRWTDEADRSDGVLGSDWVYKNGSTNPRIASGTINSNAAGIFPAEFNRRLAGPDQYASTTITQIGVTSNFLFLRGSGTGTSGTFPLLTFSNASSEIATVTSWALAGYVARATQATPVAINDFIEFFVISNVYYQFVNGVQRGDPWPDTTPIANQTGRYAGLVAQSANSTRFARLTVGDLRPSDLTTPIQAVNRSGSY